MNGRQKMIIAWVALGLAWLLTFAGLEAYALMQSDPNDGITLSRLMVEVSNAWPPFVFLLGMTVGMLASHFWWHWNPDDPRDHRG